MFCIVVSRRQIDQKPPLSAHYETVGSLNRSFMALKCYNIVTLGAPLGCAIAPVRCGKLNVHRILVDTTQPVVQFTPFIRLYTCKDVVILLRPRDYIQLYSCHQ